MRVVTFDIETANWFADTGSNDPADLQIALVCVHDSETDLYDSFLESELPRLWKKIEGADLLVGYNSDHFDIPLLNKYYPGDLTKIRSLDLMKEIHNVVGRRIKLDSVAEATLGEKKSADGLQSLRWWRAGEIDKVRKYCIKDVELTKKLYEYGIRNSALKFKELGAIREVKLDTSNWLTGKSGSHTHTLGF